MKILRQKGTHGALLVGAGILLSRIAGLIRERVFAHYFGNSDAADVFKAALRIPNFLQNLFGEGVLSASFIPVYAKLRAEEKTEAAKDLAVAIGLILLLAVLILVTIGVFATPLLIDLIAPGFDGEKKMQAITLVRVLFPGVGLLVMSAWCLGILNSHGKFFLSYSAPVLWNIAIIGALIYGGIRYSEYELALFVGWGVVVGSILQTTVQIPSVLASLGSIKANISSAGSNVRKVLKSFWPVVIGRGVVQISAYIDSILASLLPSGAVSALSYAQTIYLLPISLFGMAISAAELPALSGITGEAAIVNAKLQERLNHGLKRISYFVVPSVAAFIGLGDCIVSILFQTGKFSFEDTLYVWGILAGSTIGLLAATMGRLYASAFYALQETKIPLYFAIIRVLLTMILGYIFALILPPMLGIEAQWGTAGLTASAGLAGWVEFTLLQTALNMRIGVTGVPFRHILKLWEASALGIFCALGAKHLLPLEQGIPLSIVTVGIFGGIYLLFTWRSDT